MNGPHDLGGQDGFGPVLREENEPVFHSEWEKRMFGIAATIPFTVPFGDDHLRREIERISPSDYLNASYYELWYRSITSILKEKNVIGTKVTQQTTPQLPSVDAIRRERVATVMFEGASTRAEKADVEQSVAVGDRVFVLNNHPEHHTRVPRYVRGRFGHIVLDHGVFVFPDTNSQDEGDCPQHCYTVEFSASEIWGDQADTTSTVRVDLWESYLQGQSSEVHKT